MTLMTGGDRGKPGSHGSKNTPFSQKKKKTNTSDENKLANTQVKFNLVGDHMVNIVHSITDSHNMNYIRNFN